MHKKVVHCVSIAVISFVHCGELCVNACTAREQGPNTFSRHVHATLRATEMARIATKHCVPLREQMRASVSAD